MPQSSFDNHTKLRIKNSQTPAVVLPNTTIPDPAPVSIPKPNTPSTPNNIPPATLGGIQEQLHNSRPQTTLGVDPSDRVDFVTIVSHQLRTPLTAIKWYVDLLLAGKVGDLEHQQRDFLLDIYQSNERMIRLVDNLLIIEQLEQRKLSMIRRSISISKLVRNVLDEYETYAKVNNIALIYQCGHQNLPMVKVDSIYIRLAIKNIIDNALRYTQKRGTVVVSCEGTVVVDNKKMMRITISDTGIGIPEEERDLIFNKFYRSARSLTIQTEGTGLGLYIAKVIVEKNNGQIWFEPKDHGTVFYIQLPVSTSE